MSGSGTASRSLTNRRGSTFTDKQIAFSVRERRAVRAHLLGGVEAVSGWVCGMDDYHWGVVDGKGDVHLVHKSSSITITRESVELPSEAEAVVAPFRDSEWMKAHFGQTSQPQPALA